MLCERCVSSCLVECVFLRNVGPNSATLEMLGPSGKVCQALVANVIPYHGSADREASRPIKVRVLHAGELGEWGMLSVGYVPG